MKTAVIDTGVFVAGVFWRHEPHLILKAWLRGLLLPVVSEEVLSEYERVLESLALPCRPLAIG
jgi:predicted nucleic acid-binding protein